MFPKTLSGSADKIRLFRFGFDVIAQKTVDPHRRRLIMKGFLIGGEDTGGITSAVLGRGDANHLLEGPGEMTAVDKAGLLINLLDAEIAVVKEFRSLLNADEGQQFIGVNGKIPLHHGRYVIRMISDLGADGLQ